MKRSGPADGLPTKAPPSASTPGLTGTKLRIAEATLMTLKERGFAGASAREIATGGHFNQALIFYHFGSVHHALLAALDLVSERRMQAYRPAFEQAETIPELTALARQIHAEDVENGYVKVLGEMVAGGVSDAELGACVVARLGPWVDMVSEKLRALIAGTALESLLPADDLAFAVVALYLGADMLGSLAGEHSRAESLLDLVERFAPMLGAFSSVTDGEGAG